LSVLADATLQGRAVRAFFIALSKKTVTAHTERISGDLHGKYSLVFNVVVDSATIDVDDFSGAGNPYYLDVFPATWAPDFISENNRWLHFDRVICHILAKLTDLSFWRRSSSPRVLKCARFSELHHLVQLDQAALWSPIAIH
jgi:hypothetical protein